jgi:hypothetical protein
MAEQVVLCDTRIQLLEEFTRIHDALQWIYYDPYYTGRPTGQQVMGLGVVAQF